MAQTDRRGCSIVLTVSRTINTQGIMLRENTQLALELRRGNVAIASS